MPRVMTICPVHGYVVPTDAIMTVEQFALLKSDLAMYCKACRAPHLVTRDQVWLEDASDDRDP